MSTKNEPDRELTEGDLDQVAGGWSVNIPAPPMPPGIPIPYPNTLRLVV